MKRLEKLLSIKMGLEKSDVVQKIVQRVISIKSTIQWGFKDTDVIQMLLFIFKWH